MNIRIFSLLLVFKLLNSKIGTRTHLEKYLDGRLAVEHLKKEPEQWFGQSTDTVTASAPRQQGALYGAGQVVVDGLENEAEVGRAAVDGAENMEDAVADRQWVTASDHVLHAALQTAAAEDHRHGVAVAAAQALDQMHHDLSVREDHVRERRRLRLIVGTAAVAEVRTRPRPHSGATWRVRSVRRRLRLLFIGRRSDIFIPLLLLLLLLLQDGRCR